MRKNQPSERQAVRERQSESSEPSIGDQLSQRREDGEELLRVGEAIINRALSGNSEAFLAANRQHGGE